MSAAARHTHEIRTTGHGGIAGTGECLGFQNDWDEIEGKPILESSLSLSRFFFFLRASVSDEGRAPPFDNALCVSIYVHDARLSVLVNLALSRVSRWKKGIPESVYVDAVSLSFS